MPRTCALCDEAACDGGRVKKFSHVVGLTVLLALIAGCSAPPHGAPAFSFTEGEDIDSLNPIFTTEILVTDLSALTQGYLITFDERDRLTPSLCLQVPTKQNHLISPDGRTVVYKLRRGVRWQDGSPFTSADVSFTAKTILDPRVNVSSTLGFDQIAGISTPDDYTAVVHLKRPYAAFTAVFLTPGIGSGILPKHLLAGKDVNHAAYNSLPVGLGPFKYTRWARGSSVQMSAFDGWWGGRPKLRSITYKIISDANTAINQLRTHELSAFGRVPNEQYPAARNVAGTRTIDFATTAYEHIDFNMERPILRDRRVREALARAIDIKTIVRKVDHGAGVLACTPIPISSWAYYAATPCYPFDPAKARRLLDRAEWRVGTDGIRRKDGKPLNLTLVSTVGNLSRDETAVIVQQEFRQIGAQLQYIRYQANELFANGDGILSSGKYDLSMYAWFWRPDPDISNLYACGERPPHGQNYSRYCNPRVDTLLQDALTHYDRATRRADYVRIQTMMAHDIPSIVLYQRVDHLTADARFVDLAPGPFVLFTRPAGIWGTSKR